MFTTAEQALEIARRELAISPLKSDPLFAPWQSASLLEPVLVKDVFQKPSYWLVPVLIQGRVAGFIRVLGTGEVAAMGALYQHPEQIKSCPQIFPPIDVAEAGRQAQERLRKDLGETASAPVFVHDGPPGREAWMVVVSRGGKPSRWIFVTSAFTYERKAGEILDEAME